MENKVILKRFVREHFHWFTLKRSVLETITNAIHAGATEIKINVEYQSTLNNVEAPLNKITISDNGVGFTKDAIDSFNTIHSEYKIKIGGKGIGRLSLLKMADIVKYESYTGKEKITFQLGVGNQLLGNYDINPNNSRSGTKIELKDFYGKGIRGIENPSALKKYYFEHLQLLLFFLNKNNTSVKIIISDGVNESAELSNKELKSVKKSTFTIQSYEFTAHCFEHANKGLYLNLCAHEQLLESSVINKEYLDAGYIFYVTSTYLDKYANSERDGLSSPENEGEIFEKSDVIKKEELIKKITYECLTLIENKLKNYKQEVKKIIKERYPYITDEYLPKAESLISVSNILKDYREIQANKEDKITKNIVNNKPLSYSEVSQLAKEDLAKYMCHRSFVIDNLNNLPKKEKEEKLHNIFLPKNNNGISLADNNIWLLDDRFLSYSNIYSDEVISKIINDVDGKYYKQSEKPDIAMFFSRNNKSIANKLVIIEFKKPSADKYDASKSVVQSREYAEALCNKIDSIMEVYNFAITPINDGFVRILKGEGYSQVFSLGEKIFCRHSLLVDSNKPLHQYVMELDSVIKDAQARNKIFEDILKADKNFA